MEDVKNRDAIWTIRVCERLSPVFDARSDILPMVDYGCSSTCGWFFDREDAIEALHKNATDMWETCYNYAVIEQARQGVCTCAVIGSAQWFKYDIDRNGYFEIVTPEIVEDIWGFVFT